MEQELALCPLEPWLADRLLVGKFQGHIIVHIVVCREKSQDDQIGRVFMALVAEPKQLLVVSPAAGAHVDHLDPSYIFLYAGSSIVEQFSQLLTKSLFEGNLHSLYKRVTQHQNSIDI